MDESRNNWGSASSEFTLDRVLESPLEDKGGQVNRQTKELRRKHDRSS